MADVTLSYKGSDVLELSNSGSATLKTGGKYCEDDIAVEYVKPSGGGVLNGVIRLDVAASDTTPVEYLETVAPKLQNLDVGLLARIKGIKISGIKGEVKINANGTNRNYSQNVLEYIDLDGAKAKIGSGNLIYEYKLETINAKLRSESAINVTFCPQLKNLDFQVGKLSHNTSFSQSPLLTDVTLVNLANGLDGSLALTLSLNTASKNKLSTIMGTVSQVTDEDSNTYDFFTTDENGTVTLMDFITNTKGWTVA